MEAAQTFVRRQTMEHKHQLKALVIAAFFGRLRGLRVRTAHDRLVVSDRQGDFALATRYSVRTLEDGNSLLGDLLRQTAILATFAERAIELRTAVPEPTLPRAPSLSEPPAPEHGQGFPESERVLITLPGEVPAGAREAAIAASARLRLERRLVPGATVEVRTKHGTLTFAPLRDDRSPLEAAFTFERDGQRLDAGLRLKRREDPISLRVRGDAGARLIAEGWAAALIVYAELTCVDPPEPVVTEPTKRPSPSAAASATPGPRHPRSTGRSSGAAAAAGTVYATAFTAAVEQLRSVSGHLRRLQPGHTCSLDQVRAAERVGVRVPAGYTWVRPHHRGNQAIRIILPGSGRLW